MTLSNALVAYNRKYKRHVRGWFTRIDAEVFSTLLTFQDEHNINGGCCEIGVHHGKSFIPLCLSLKDQERALCIDIFDNQEENLDISGRGDRARLFANLDRFHIDRSRIHVIAESSENISAERIRGEIGSVRFFSIDGGHWRSIVQNDLRLAEGSLASGGVIALDDIFRAAWPDVTLGFALWFDQTKTDIVPFACGTNKLYLCQRDFAPTYRESLRTEFLKTFYEKTYRSQNFELDSYRTEILNWDEAHFIEVSRSALKAFFPDFIFMLQSPKLALKQLLRTRM